MTHQNRSTTVPDALSQADTVADIAYKALTTNVPLHVLRGLEKRHMDALYALGYYFYSQAKYKEALPLFQGLTFYNSIDRRGWLGAAGCHEMLKQYEQALTCYSFAALLDVSDPIPALHALDCYIAIKNYPKALSCLEAVVLLCGQKTEYSELKKRAEVLRDHLR